MLVRAIGVMYPNIDTTDYYKHYFNDSHEISSWAEDSVQFAYENDIMQGTGNNCISPLGNTTCEQAILLVNRIYENKNVFDKRNKDSEKAIETIKTLNFDEDDEVKSVSVSFSDGSSTEDVKIKEVKKSDPVYTTTGMKGSAVNITSSEDFDEATIAFEYNSNELNGTNPNDLAVAWYNTDLDRIEVLESNVNTSTNTVSVKTTHFSKYLLVDSKEWYSVWQRGQTIVRETDNNGRYADKFSVQLVVDCSTSMSGDRLPNAKKCTYDFITKLSPEDKFSVISFSDTAITTIPETQIEDVNLNDVENSINSLRLIGGTNFNAALTACIDNTDTGDGYDHIIVFLSDGGPNNPVEKSVFESLRDNNIRIAAVALGSGSNTAVMQQLSDETNGQYVYAENSEDLNVIYEAIQGSLIGVDATDTDGDGIPDMIEITGMKNQYGTIIRTDPNKYDTDGDGKSDGEEMGELIETDIVSEMDRKKGITSCVYFLMVSDPVEGHEVSEDVGADVECNMSLLDTIDSKTGRFDINLEINVKSGNAKNIVVEFKSNECVDIILDNYVGYAYTDYDGRLTIEELPKGTHSYTIKLQCMNISGGTSCNIIHSIKANIKGDNIKKTYTNIDIDDTLYSTEIVNITASSLDEWNQKIESEERSLIGLASFMIDANGKQIYTGNIIIDREVLEYNEIEVKIPHVQGVGLESEYQMIKLGIPSKIKYTIHKHNLHKEINSTSIGSLMAGLVEQKIVLTQQCDCGYTNQVSWEMPLEDIAKMGSSKYTGETLYVKTETILPKAMYK